MARALAQRDLDAAEAAGLDKRRRKLLEFVEITVKYPWRVTDAQVEDLRRLDFSDEQLFETALNVAFFMFLTTMADVYGLEDTGMHLADSKPELADHDEIIVGGDLKAWEEAGAVHQPGI